MPKSYINHIETEPAVTGKERQEGLIDEVTDGRALTPSAVVYKDIDEAFKEWAESLRICDEDGVEFPTMSLYSNQRFSEYSQSWQYTDDKNNLMLNFKTITRDINPKYGTIHGGLSNIPGRRYYTVRRDVVMDDNGSESIRTVKMRQPVAVDFQFRLSVFTTMFEKINEFNAMLIHMFSAKQVYVSPKGHYMPMLLDSIADKSEYQIDDRRFYSQEYTILLKGYIISEDDFITEETPLKKGVDINLMRVRKRKPVVEIDDSFESKAVELTIEFPVLKDKAEFTMDSDISIDTVSLENIVLNYKISVNGERLSVREDEDIILHDKDKVAVSIRRRNPMEAAKMVMKGRSLDESSAVDGNVIG